MKRKAAQQDALSCVTLNGEGAEAESGGGARRAPGACFPETGEAYSETELVSMLESYRRHMSADQEQRFENLKKNRSQRMGGRGQQKCGGWQGSSDDGVSTSGESSGSGKDPAPDGLQNRTPSTEGLKKSMSPDSQSDCADDDD